MALSMDRWQLVKDGSTILVLSVIVVTALRGDWVPRVVVDAALQNCARQLEQQDERVTELTAELHQARQDIQRLLQPVGGGGAPR